MVLLKTLVFTDTTKKQNKKQNYLPAIVNKERLTNIKRNRFANINRAYKFTDINRIYRFIRVHRTYRLMNINRTSKFTRITRMHRFTRINRTYTVAYPEVNLGAPRARSASMGKSDGGL